MAGRESQLVTAERNQPNGKFVRASSAPMAMKCPQSLTTTEYKIDTGSEAADLGTAFHRLIAKHIEFGDVHSTWIDAVAANYRVDAEELTTLFYMGSSMWSQIYRDYPSPVCESEMLCCEMQNNWWITGHVDLISTASGQIRIADWKTGYKTSSDYWPQMAAYAALAFSLYSHSDTCHASILWVRNQERDSYEFTREQIEAWAGNLVDRLDGGAYSVGGHCAYCSRRSACPAYRQEMEANAVMFLTCNEFDRLDDVAVIGDMYAKADMVEKAAARVKEIIRAHIVANGPIQWGENELALVDVERDEICGEASRFFQARFGHDMVEAAKFSKTKLKPLIMAEAERGQKIKLWEQVLSEMEYEGLVEKKQFQRLEMRTTKKSIEG